MDRCSGWAHPVGRVPDKILLLDADRCANGCAGRQCRDQHASPIDPAVAVLLPPLEGRACADIQQAAAGTS